VSEELESVGDGSSDATRLRLVCGAMAPATVHGCLESIKQPATSNDFGNEQSQLKQLAQLTSWCIILWFLV
jgi:hypothetical protein